jgi:predicted DNA-binding protein
MTTAQNNKTRNIRIPMAIHERLKHKCKEEGRLLGVYIGKILKKAISDENREDVAKQEQPPQSK